MEPSFLSNWASEIVTGICTTVIIIYLRQQSKKIDDLTKAQSTLPEKYQTIVKCDKEMVAQDDQCKQRHDRDQKVIEKNEKNIYSLMAIISQDVKDINQKMARYEGYNQAINNGVVT